MGRCCNGLRETNLNQHFGRWLRSLKGPTIAPAYCRQGLIWVGADTVDTPLALEARYHRGRGAVHSVREGVGRAGSLWCSRNQTTGTALPQHLTFASLQHTLNRELLRKGLHLTPIGKRQRVRFPLSVRHEQSQFAEPNFKSWAQWG